MRLNERGAKAAEDDIESYAVVRRGSGARDAVSSHEGRGTRACGALAVNLRGEGRNVSVQSSLRRQMTLSCWSTPFLVRTAPPVVLAVERDARERDAAGAPPDGDEVRRGADSLSSTSCTCMSSRVARSCRSCECGLARRPRTPTPPRPRRVAVDRPRAARTDLQSVLGASMKPFRVCPPRPITRQEPPEEGRGWWGGRP